MEPNVYRQENRSPLGAGGYLSTEFSESFSRLELTDGLRLVQAVRGMTFTHRKELSPGLKGALHRLDALVNWERRDRKDLERTLAPVLNLLEELGNPHTAWKSVHVTGTKGKSSTSSLIALGLKLAGHSTAFYSSPHVERVTERVRISGEEADDDAFAAAIERGLAAQSKVMEATYFDVLTAAAFDLFARERVDWGVIECGLGGRLDSTNAVASEVAVITNVDLEHTETLGSTRAAIAREKVGILKPDSVLVTGIAPEDGEVWPVLERAAQLAKSEIVSVPLAGRTLLQSNLALAQTVLDVLGRRGFETTCGKLLTGELLEEGLAQRNALPGRMEFFSHLGTQIVLDGAHVAPSITRVLDETDRVESLRGKPVCILALRSDKDHHALLKTLRGRVDRVICTSLDSAPFRSASELEATAKGIGLTATAVDDPAEALSKALEIASSDGWVLAIGSLYLAGALRHELGDA